MVKANLWIELLYSSANCSPLCDKRILVYGVSGAARARVTHPCTTSSEAQGSPDNSNSNKLMCSLSLSWRKTKEMLENSYRYHVSEVSSISFSTNHNVMMQPTGTASMTTIHVRIWAERWLRLLRYLIYKDVLSGIHGCLYKRYFNCS